ncbi:hypothetical protein PS373_08440, partial [Limosilactobacillus fermentum]
DGKKLDDQITKELRELIELHVMTERAVKFDLVSDRNGNAPAYLTSVIDGTTTDKWAELTPFIFPEVSLLIDLDEEARDGQNEELGFIL